MTSKMTSSKYETILLVAFRNETVHYVYNHNHINWIQTNFILFVFLRSVVNLLPLCFEFLAGNSL